jgi:hypothetical protein
MRSRASMQRVQFDYEAELARHMCEGCNKVHGGGRTLTGYVCTMYNYVPPKMFRDANECPHNYRRRKLVRGKVHVGQGKTKAGGNR